VSDQDQTMSVLDEYAGYKARVSSLMILSRFS
jgi:hypothetical protein